MMDLKLQLLDISLTIGEKLSDEPGIRWTDRIYPDGYWEPNLFQFYNRIYPKMQQALPVPFQMDGVSRVDDTPAHKALREAIVNTLVHAYHTGMGNIVIERYPYRLVFSNPGTMLVSAEDYSSVAGACAATRPFSRCLCSSATESVPGAKPTQ